MSDCCLCRQLLSDGLDLCVRARKMDAIDRTNDTLSVSSDPKNWEDSGLFSKHAKQHNTLFPDQPLLTKSATMHVWVLDQYETDLAEWERKSRAHLMQCDSSISAKEPRP